MAYAQSDSEISKAVDREQEWLIDQYNRNREAKDQISNTDEIEMKKEENSVIKEYLNHLGDDHQKKIYFTGYMINKLIKCCMGVIPFDDRDSYLNKRFETPGYLLGNLTFQCIHKITKDIRSFITKEVHSGLWNLNKQHKDIINEIYRNYSCQNGI